MLSVLSFLVSSSLFVTIFSTLSNDAKPDFILNIIDKVWSEKNE